MPTVKQKSAPPKRGNFFIPPQENIWLWLRQSLEKAARSGDKISESSILVAMYAKARTYFERKS